MKPLQLTLRGINSYRKEQTIDFARLTSAGLFGIFGPTGSGKSSILDAITLALYARLPRSTKNFININEQTAFVSFLFSITTTVTKIYQVERTFRYHKNGDTFTVRNTAGTLTEITEKESVVLADRPTEVTQECISLLGLTADDFMKTVVLPQGQFSEFLKLKNAERRGMLQRIFHLEKYGLELTQKIAAARQKQELLLSNLEGQLQMFSSYTPERLDDIRQKLSATSSTLSDAEKEKKAQEATFQEMDALRSLWEEYEPLKKQYDTALLSLPSIEKEEATLQLSKKANQLRPFALQAEAAQQERQQAAAALAEAETALEEAKKAAKTAEQQKEEFLLQYEKHTVSLHQQEQLFQSFLEKSHSILKWKEKQEEIQAKLHQERGLFHTLLQEQDVLKERLQKSRSALQTLEQNAAALQVPPDTLAAFEQGHILEETWREKKNRYENEKTFFLEQQNALRQEQEKQKAQEKQLINYQRQANAIHRQLLHLLEQATAQKKELQQLQNDGQMQLEQLQHGHMALVLRSALKPGETCPVCGHPHVESIPLETSNTASEDVRLSEIQRKKKALKNVETKLSALSENISFLEKYFSLFDSCLRTIHGLLPQDIATSHEDDDSSAKKTEEAAPLSEQCLHSLLQTIQQEASAFGNSQGRLSQSILQQKQQKQQLDRQHTLLQKDADVILSLRQQWKTENFTEALSSLRKQGETLQKIQKDISLRRQQADDVSEKLSSLSQTLLRASASISSMEGELGQYESLCKEEEATFTDGYDSSTDYSGLLQKIQQTFSTMEQQKKEREDVFRESERLLLEKKEVFLTRESLLAACENTLLSSRNTFLEQLALSGFPDTSSLESLYLPEEKIQQKEQDIQEFRDQLSHTKARLSYLEEKIKSRTFSPEVWENTRQLLTDIIKKIETLRKEGALLSHAFEDCEKQLQKKNQLEKEKEQAVHRRSIIRELEQLFKGNAFIEYVAKSRLSYIASEASDILEDISNGAYTLEINALSEFIIRDNKNGGVLRPCDTLSGGEIFLTSLSLALALSSVIQLNGTAPLELFFLDEGFGSLDEELLDVVMNCLEHLQNGSRSIGIISHVEAIQSRVPVKLMVTPSDIEQNGSSIRME
ncbi:MAG: SMC family ATPase [Eubacteriales bacterium]|nr:SMC family ATPase [Eubacteriales bacterium]